MAASGRKTACVTGGNGYIASALIKMLLEKGYAVNTTVRNPDDKEKNSHIDGLKALGPLEVFRADLEDEGSFDDAVAGCDYAFLLAAPVNYTAADPEKELIEPAVRGTLNVLRSCVKAGTVKRVVLTSSTAAVSSKPLQGSGHVLDEDSWSDVEYLTAHKTGLWLRNARVHRAPLHLHVHFLIRHFLTTTCFAAAFAWQGYPVSKVLLEKAASRFAEEHGLSLVTLCPSVTVGAAPDEKVYTTVPAILSLLSGDEAELRVLRGIERASGSVPLVHVDDVCRAEVFVAEADAAAGRYICNSLDTTIIEIARFLADKYPQYDVNTELSGDLLAEPIALLPSAKLTGEGFEFKYKTLEDIYEDMVDYGKSLGILRN